MVEKLNSKLIEIAELNVTIDAPPVKHKIVELHEPELYDGGRLEDIEVHNSQR